MATLIKLKNKGIPNSTPAAADLEIGEIALNYADGKIFYKNSSNQIAQFLDSGQIVGMIDADYIDDRVGGLYLDSGETQNIIDSVLSNVSQHIVPDGNIVYDLGDSNNRFRDLYLSGSSIVMGDIVMSEHVGRIRFTNHTTNQEVHITGANVNPTLIDSSVIADVIDFNYLDSVLQNSLTYLDSGQITTRIDDAIDVAVQGILDSEFYLDSESAKNLFTVSGDVLTYDAGLGNIGTLAGVLYQRNLFDSDIATLKLTDIAETDSARYYRTSRVDSAIDVKVDAAFINALNVTAQDATLLAGNDSAYYLNYDNFTSTPFILDSSMVKNIFSTADSSVLKYNALTGRFTTNQANFYTTAKFDSDFDSAFGAKTTTDVPEGTNLYYTTGRHDSDLIAGFAARTTNILTEGSSNKYYTVVRVDSDIDAKVTKAYVDNLSINANQLNGQLGGYYSDYTNLTNAPNVLDSTNVKEIFSVSGGVLAYDDSTGVLSTITNKLYRTVNFDSDLAERTTTDLAEGTNEYYTTARADSDAKRAISVTDAGGDGSLAYNTSSGVITYTGPSAADVRFHFSGGNGITLTAGEIATDSTANVEFNQVAVNGRTIYGGTFGAVNINDNTTLGDATASVLGYTSDDSSRNSVLNLAINNQYSANIGVTLNNEFIFGTQNADITYKFVKSTGVSPIDFTNPDTLFEIAPTGKSKFYSAADALSKTNAALTIVGGLGVDKTIRSNDIVVVNNITAGTNGTGKFIGDLTGTVSDISNHTTTDLTEGDNLYYTTVRFDSDLTASTTSDLSEGTNRYYTTARADSDAKRAISVNDVGGDGSLSYAEATGQLTYTGPSATEVRSHFTAGTGVTITNGEIAIGQAVGTQDSVEYGGGLFTGDVVIQGDLTITGTQSSQAQADLSVSNAYIVVADSNEQDNVDIGIVGQYSDDNGVTRRHTGFVRDASNGEWYVFDNLIQDNIDSSPRAQTLNLDDSTVNLPTWNFGALRGQYLGFDSDFTQYSTNYQVKESDFSAVTANRYAVDTTDGLVTCTLPASPSVGDYIRLIDISNWRGDNTVMLNRNGSTIEGYTDDFNLDVGQSIIELIYINNTWNIYSSIGQRGPAGEKGDSADSANFASTSQAIAFAIGLG